MATKRRAARQFLACVVVLACASCSDAAPESGTVADVTAATEETATIDTLDATDGREGPGPDVWVSDAAVGPIGGKPACPQPRPCDFASASHRYPSPHVMLVVDLSGSMHVSWSADDSPDKILGRHWTAVRTALEGVLGCDGYDDLVNFGLQVYPGYKPFACSLHGPRVTIAPRMGQTILDTLPDPLGRSGRSPWSTPVVGVNPIVEALDRAVAHVSQRASDRRAAILLVTDGGVDCGPTEPDPYVALVRRVGSAYRQLGIPTFPVVVDKLSGSVDLSHLDGVGLWRRVEVFDDLARAGGFPLPAARKYYTTRNEADVHFALQDILGRLFDCRCGCPEEPSGSGGGNGADAGSQADAPDAGGQPGPTPWASCAGRCGDDGTATKCSCSHACALFPLGCCADYESSCGCVVDADCAKPEAACFGPNCNACKTARCVLTHCSYVDKCDDGDSCTIDSCDLAAGGKCKHVDRPDGTPCNDHFPCTAKDQCKSGKCAGTADPSADDKPCSDDDWCTVGDRCKAGKCAPGKPRDCDDGQSCTEDGCDPVRACRHLDAWDGKSCADDAPCRKDPKCVHGTCQGPLLPEGSACDDGNACTVDDKCTYFGACLGGPGCDDGDPCTKDACAGASAKCTHAVLPDGAACRDDKPCRASGECKAGKCTGGVAADGTLCDDNNSCTWKDACFGGHCLGGENMPYGTGCHDAGPCVVGVCLNGECLAKKTGGPCDDHNPCTLDICKPTGLFEARCSFAPVTASAACDDGDPCTTNGQCTQGRCVGKPTCTFQTLLHETFACAGTTSWTLDPPAGSGQPGWAIDASPAIAASEDGGCSLNFNDGKSYQSALAVHGPATSPAIQLPTGGALRLRFASYNGVEATRDFDLRRVTVSDDGFASSQQSWTLRNDADRGLWAPVSLDLSAFAGRTVQVRFAFDSRDPLDNSGPGWFVDDVQVRVGLPLPRP